MIQVLLVVILAQVAVPEPSLSLHLGAGLILKTTRKTLVGESGLPGAFQGAPLPAWIMLRNDTAESGARAHGDALAAERLDAAREGRPARFPEQQAAPRVRLPSLGRGWVDHAELSLSRIEVDGDGRETKLPRLAPERLDAELLRSPRITARPATVGALGSSVPITLSPQLTAELEPGIYELGCVVDCRESSELDSWRGRLAAEGLRFQVMEPAPELASDIAFARGAYFVAMGTPEAALDDLATCAASDHLWAADALSLRAAALFELGRFEEALAQYTEYQREVGDRLSPRRRSLLEARLGRCRELVAETQAGQPGER